MNLIWHGASPNTIIGYSLVTREIVSRIAKLGHNVIIASKTDIGSPFMWGDIQVIQGKDINSLQFYIETKKDIDYIFSVQDPWEDLKPFRNMVSLAVLDIEHAFPSIVDKLKRSRFQFCVSRHNLEEFRKWRLNPFYCPYGVDTNFYNSDNKMRNDFREKHNIDNGAFVIGCVGQNMYSDRKNFTGLLRAFTYFSEKHDDAILYLHTNIDPGFCPFRDFIRGTMGYDPSLRLLIKRFGIEKKVRFVNQSDYWMHFVTQEEMKMAYNGIDIFCLPTKGESFGLPILETQACGTPAVLTDTTSCPELLKGGWLIPIEEDDYQYTDTESWAANPRPKVIAETLEFAYEAWSDNKLDAIGLRAREGILEYNWDVVFEKYWIPFLSFLEDNK